MLLILDLDGTIIETGKPLDSQLAYQLKKFLKKSHILITTARHPKGVSFVLEEKIGFIPTISLNGAAIHLTSWLKFDRVVYFNEEIINGIIKALSCYEVTLSFYGKSFWDI